MIPLFLAEDEEHDSYMARQEFSEIVLIPWIVIVMLIVILGRYTYLELENM